MNALSNVESVIGKRIGMLKESNPELTAEWAMFDDDWGIITLSLSGALYGFEFIESETSWELQGRSILYGDILEQGVTLVIIVPQEAYLRVRMAIRGTEGPVTLLSYDCIGITPTPRPS